MSTDERRARIIARRADAGEDLWPDHMDTARAIRTSDEAAGMVLVPREMTEKMIDKFHNQIMIRCEPDEREATVLNSEDVWESVIAAATESDNG